MKRFILGGIALIAIIGAAQAADLPPMAPLPAKAPAMVPAPRADDWTGFYLGGYIGNAMTHASGSTTGTAGVAGMVDGSWSGGITAGANWQFAPSWLIGFEGDFGYLGGTRLFQELNDADTTGIKGSWYGTARGRFGYVTGPSLLYVTGGVGFVHVTDTFGTIAAPTASTTTTIGGVFGGGIETKLTRNWSTKTEYLYIDGGSAHSFTSNTFGAVTPASVTHNYQVIKTGVNYRFDGNFESPPIPFVADPPRLASNHNWNGFYVGGNAGIGVAMTQTAGIPPTPTIGDVDMPSNGFTGGGQIGANYMLWDKFLLGVEGDFNALTNSRSATDWNDAGAVLVEKTNWYGTARIRVGGTTGPALLYSTVGWGWVNVQDGFAAVPGAPAVLVTRTGSGLTFGGGAEVAIDAHWSAKVESLFLRAGSTSVGDVPAGFGTIFKDQFAIIRAGVNYSLN